MTDMSSTKLLSFTPASEALGQAIEFILDLHEKGLLDYTQSVVASGITETGVVWALVSSFEVPVPEGARIERFRGWESVGLPVGLS